MALTLTYTGDWSRVAGNQRVNTVSIAFDSSYASGGEALTARTLGLSTVTSVQAQAKSGYSFEYDYTNEKLMVYWTPALSHTHQLVFPVTTATAPAQLAANDLGASATAFTVAGVPTTSATHGGVVNAGVTQIAAAEVTNATDLSTLTGVIVVAWGY
jgi:hypothetical protein